MREVGVYFEVGEFPEVCIDDTGGALGDEEAVLMFDNEGEEFSLGCGSAFAEVGKRFDFASVVGDAILTHGTDETLRLAWGADQSAEFHQGLI